jgi:hypothetical protein
VTTTWEQALDELERHLQEAEALLRGDAEEISRETWEKPHGLGPIPEHLVDRAMRLRERQAIVIAAIPRVLTEKRQQRRVAERLEQGSVRSASAAAVYVDVTA